MIHGIDTSFLVSVELASHSRHEATTVDRSLRERNVSRSETTTLVFGRRPRRTARKEDR